MHLPGNLTGDLLYGIGIVAVLAAAAVLTARFRRQPDKCPHGRTGDCADCWYDRQY